MQQEEQIKDQLKNILGEACLSTGAFKPNSREMALAKAVNYLALQMRMLSKMDEADMRQSHLEGVLGNTAKILSQKENEL